jgi:hypothetical protein
MTANIQTPSPISSPPDPALAQFLTDIEKDLLLHILENMKNRKISIGDAQKLAQDFLALLPPIDKEDLLNKLNSLSPKYPEAREVYAAHVSPHEEQKQQQLLQTMRDHIKSGDIEQAIAVAKGGTHV